MRWCRAPGPFERHAGSGSSICPSCTARSSSDLHRPADSVRACAAATAGGVRARDLVLIRSRIMSHRKHAPREKSFEDEPVQQYTWIVYAVGMLLVGGLAGYVLSIGTAA